MGYYALILAGGGGTRLWPLSRSDRPKQMLSLVGNQTMFQMSVHRLMPLFPPEQIFVVTGADHLEALRAQCPELPAANFIVEPVGRDTGPAAGLGAVRLLHRDPDAVIAVLTSDHHIGAEARFRQVLKAGNRLAERGPIVTLGIAPSFPSSGYAYLERGEQIDEIDGFPCYRAVDLREKPDPLTAAEFLLSGRYSWNSGMLICRADLMLKEIRRQAPPLGDVLDRLAQALDAGDYAEALCRWWPEVPKISIDQAIMLNAENMVIMTVDIGWSDVGTWNTLYETLKLNADENVVKGDAPVMHLRTYGTFVMSQRLVVTIGVEDLVIVDTDDVLLVCRRDQSEDVRHIVAMLKDQGHDIYL